LQAAAAVLLVAGGMIAGRLSAGNNPFAETRAASADTTPPFRTMEEALAAQSRAQLDYQAATAFLAQVDTARSITGTPRALQTRLAALDRVREAMNEGLTEAPYDPVINTYMLTTLGQREATLRQLNTVLPVGMRIKSY
jgi:hypothetical protein